MASITIASTITTTITLFLLFIPITTIVLFLPNIVHYNT